MQITVRSCLTAGVVFASAGAIAITPIAPTLPNVHTPAVYMSAAAVDLAATVNPIEAWLQVFGQGAQNVATIGGQVIADPAPALRQLLVNQLGYAQTVTEGLIGTTQALFDYATQTVPAALQAIAVQIAQGDITGAAATLNDALGGLVLAAAPLFETLAIPAQMTENLNRVVQTLTGLPTLLPIVIGVLGPVEAVVAAAGNSGQEFVDALGGGDAIAALNALINTPAAITGAFINGYAPGDGSVIPGLLTVSDDQFNTGLVQTLFVNLPKAIAAALTPPVNPLTANQEVSAVPKLDTATLVSVGSTDNAAPAPEVNAPTTKSGSSVRTSGSKSAATAAPSARTQAAAVQSGGDNKSAAPAKAGGGGKNAGGGAKGTGAKSARGGDGE